MNLMNLFRRREPVPNRAAEIAEQQVKSDETKRVVDDILRGMREAERAAVPNRIRRK